MAQELRKYTEKQTLFLENLAGPAKGNVLEAMRLAGYGEDVSSTSIIRSLKNEIIEIAKDMLAGASIKAVIGLEEALENPNALGTKQKIAAAQQLLDRAGLVKPPEDQGLKLEVGEGVIILPAKRSLEQSKVIEGEIIDV